MYFFNFYHLRITLQISDLILGIKFRAPSLLLPSLILSYFQALIQDFLWWWACSWPIFSLKWRLQLSFLLLRFAIIDLQETNNFIDEEDPRLIKFYMELHSYLLLTIFLVFNFFLLFLFFYFILFFALTKSNVRMEKIRN